MKLDKHDARSLPALPVKSEEAEHNQIKLLARVFDDTEKAGQALKSLEEWNRLHSLKLHATALLVKDEQGNTSEFLERAQEHLQPGTSAFIIIVERDSVQSLNTVMAGMEGVVLQQTITDTLVEELLQESQAEE